MCNVVGLVGRRGSGKGTVSKVFMAHGDRLFAFADPLKDVVSTVYDLPRHLLEGETPESREWRKLAHPNLGGKTPEQALQQIGTEGFRAFYSETWVNKLTRSILLLPPGTRAVVTDVRFVNEFEALRQLGASFIYIHRPGIDRQNHSSEQVEELMPFCDHYINNDGSVEDLLQLSQLVRNVLINQGKY